MTPASIVIPTRDRLPYLDVALSSLAGAAAELGVDVLVIDDGGPSFTARELVLGHGARYLAHEAPLGLNVARNTGVERSDGELLVFVDDDIRASPGWLQAILDAASENPEVDVFAGRITASLEGPAPRTCGREAPPITTLDLGAKDRDTRFAWGTNMTIRRRALERIGPFDVSLEHGGDEQEWQERLRASTPGARVRYVAAASVEHRRAGEDARLRALAGAAQQRGRAARRFDASRGEAPSSGRELLTLTGCVGHVLRRRCPAGLTMVAHSSGRMREALCEAATRRAGAREEHPAAAAEAEDFLSGSSGTVGGLDALRRAGLDEAINARELISGERLRLARAARLAPPRRRVLALGIERPEHRELARAIRSELSRSRHDVELHTSPPGVLGKFENLNEMLLAHPLDDHDWLLILDDDVELPHGFLDRFLFLCERFSLALAQPAHRLNSHAAWPVTRRHPGSVVRETGFVEIGPVTALARRTLGVLVPFPDLRMGWGLDLHWSALAREHGWRCGVTDAVSIRHRAAPAAAAYSHGGAVAEARTFLAERPYLSADEAGRTLTTHRRW
jgi:GT2 family glycosyltransferase